MEYFTSNYKCVSVRVCASDEVRKKRGWVFTPGIDDAQSECGLDSYSCDCHVTNNGDDDILIRDIRQLVDLVKT